MKKSDCRIKKILLPSLLIVLLSAVTSGCHNMCGQLSKTIGDTSWYDRLEWKDSSNPWPDITKNKELNSNFTASPTGEVTAKGSAGYINNWMLSQLGMDIKGFEAEIKLTSDSRRSGFQLFSTNSYRRYSVYLDPAGKFYLYFNEGSQKGDGDLIFQKKDVTGNALEYNTIRMEINSDRSSSFYVNDEFVCNVPDHQIVYGMYGMSTITNKSNAVTAYYRFKRVQH